MVNGPPATEAQSTGAGVLLALVPGLLAQSAQQAERIAALERSGPELASRLDGRITSLEGHLARQGDHLAAQDAGQAAFRLEVKSQLGTLQQQLGALQAAEQQRAQDARQAAQDARDAEARAQQGAQEQRREYRRWALQTVVSVAFTVPGLVWPLIVTRPLPLRLGVPAVCIGLVLLLASWAWLRSRR